jgi:nitrous oxide reductase
MSGQTRAMICKPQELGVWYFPADNTCHWWHWSSKTYTIHNVILAIEAQSNKDMKQRHRHEGEGDGAM